tara:strand:- start:2264 stop:5254 length:2991 start_codon:yes stop_codon:yes gene_type:complete
MALACMRKQKWKDAKEHFKNFENEFTWIDKINFGKVLLRRGEYSHVIKLCDQVLEEPSPGEKSSEYALILKAQSYLEEGKYQDVINIVNEFLTYDPYNNQMKRIKYTATNRLTLTPKEISQEEFPGSTLSTNNEERYKNFRNFQKMEGKIIKKTKKREFDEDYISKCDELIIFIQSSFDNWREDFERNIASLLGDKAKAYLEMNQWYEAEESLKLAQEFGLDKFANKFFNQLSERIEHQKKYNEAVKKMQEGDMNTALKLFLKFKEAGRNKGVVANIARCYYEQKNFDKALPYYKILATTALKEKITDYNIQRLYGQTGAYFQILISLKRLDEAEDIINSMIKKFENIEIPKISTADLYLKKTTLHIFQKRFDDALEMNTKSLSKIELSNNDIGYVYLQRAKILVWANTELDEALECIQRSKSVDKDWVPKARLEAEVYELQGNFEKAIEILDEYIQKPEKLSVTEVNELKAVKAYSLVKSRKVDDGVKLILNLRENVFKTKFLDYLFTTIVLIQKEHFHQESILMLCDIGIEMQPNTAFWYWQKAKAFRTLFRYPEALAEINKAIDYDENNSNSWNNKASILLDMYGGVEQSPNAKEIRECLEKSLRLNPENTHAMCNLAQIEENEENFEKAKEMYQDALEIDPENIWIRNREAYFYWSIAKFEEAQNCIDYIKANFPVYGTTELIAAQISYSTGNILESENICRKYLSTAISLKRRSKANEILSKCYRDKRQIDDAIGCINKAIELTPTVLRLVVEKIKLLTDKGDTKEIAECLKIIDKIKSSGNHEKGESMQEFDDMPYSSTKREEDGVVLPKTVEEFASASIDTLIKMDESGFLEFKSSMINGGMGKPNAIMNKETTETIAGFLNSEGGTLVIGFNDDEKKIVGIEIDFEKLGKKKNLDGWQLAFNNIFNDHIGLSYSEYLAPIEFDIIDGKTLAKISVSRSNDPVFWEPDNNTEAFPVRFNNSTRKLGVKDVSEYIDRHFTKSNKPLLEDN